jgi:CRP-like cAMP-binding protein
MRGALSAVLPPGDRNAILESLGRDSRKALQGRLSTVRLDADRLLFTEEEGVKGLYFPLSAVICRLVSLPDGTTVKVSLAGREGVVGISAVMDHAWSAFRTVVQLPGTALFLAGREARRLLDTPQVAEALFRYVRVLLRETSLTAACNRSHTATQRLSRWLLLIRDRAERDEFPITHESLAAMLGVRRERVSLSAQELRRNRALDYRRGAISITNGPVLETESCSCYEAITNVYVRFLRGAKRQ